MTGASMTPQFIDSAGLRPASDLVLAGPLAFVNGLIGADLERPKLALAESVEAQTRHIMRNLDALLAAQGLSRKQVVAVTVWLRDFSRFRERFEKVWPECFMDGQRPTRQLVGATGLVRDALVSMDFVIARPGTMTFQPLAGQA
jgi:2-iminobutanoate/2-iminopropanoate deaminase